MPNRPRRRTPDHPGNTLDRRYLRWLCAGFFLSALEVDPRLSGRALDLLAWLFDADGPGHQPDAVATVLAPGPRRAPPGQARHRRPERAGARGATAPAALLDAIRALAGDGDFADQPAAARNLERLARALDLNRTEAALCRLALFTGAVVPARRYLDPDAMAPDRTGRRPLEYLLGAEQSELDAALDGRLLDTGLLHRRAPAFTRDAVRMLEDPEATILGGKLLRRVMPGDSPLPGGLDADTRACLSALLGHAPTRTSTHVLVRGPAGESCLNLATGLAGGIPAPFYELDPAGPEVSGRMRLLSAVARARRGAGSVVILNPADFDRVDEHPECLPERGPRTLTGAVMPFLGIPGVRSLWIDGEQRSLGRALRRRFTLDVQLQTPGVAWRRTLWKTALERYDLGGCLSDEELDRLAAGAPRDRETVARLVRRARDAADTGKIPPGSALRLLLDSHDRLNARTRRRMPGYPREPAVAKAAPEGPCPEFTLSGINVVRGDLQLTLRQLKLFDRRLREGQKDPGAGPRNANLLLDGQPGTGKTELARHVAATLERPAVVRRGSDLLDCWVGQTEKNVAAAFAEAQARNAVLIIDEADTLLFSRARAHRSWEQSMVNEVLTSMEAYRGVLVFTTNMLAALDPAAIRRFNWKLTLGPLDAGGNEVFHDRLLAPLCAGALTARQRQELRALRDLTPGDFRIVRDRFALCEPGETDHDALLQALAAEARIKRENRGGRPAGFVAPDAKGGPTCH